MNLYSLIQGVRVSLNSFFVLLLSVTTIKKSQEMPRSEQRNQWVKVLINDKIISLKNLLILSSKWPHAENFLNSRKYFEKCEKENIQKGIHSTGFNLDTNKARIII